MYERYTQLIDEEERFILKLEACELAEHALFDMVYKSEQEPDSTIMKEILMAVHAIDLRLQAELLELQLEKKHLAHKIKPLPPSSNKQRSGSE